MSAKAVSASAAQVDKKATERVLSGILAILDVVDGAGVLRSPTSALSGEQVCELLAISAILQAASTGTGAAGGQSGKSRRIGHSAARTAPTLHALINTLGTRVFQRIEKAAVRKAENLFLEIEETRILRPIIAAVAQAKVRIERAEDQEAMAEVRDALRLAQADVAEIESLDEWKSILAHDIVLLPENDLPAGLMAKTMRFARYAAEKIGTPVPPIGYYTLTTEYSLSRCPGFAFLGKVYLRLNAVPDNQLLNLVAHEISHVSGIRRESAVRLMALGVETQYLELGLRPLF